MNSSYKWLLAVVLAGAAASPLADCSDSLSATFTPTSFTEATGGTLVDSSTGLMWMRCSLGQTWQDGVCLDNTAAPSGFSWADALTAAEDASSAGYSDWRLPNKNELETLVERACFDPSINEELFPGTASIGHWTNSASNVNEAFAWAVNFANGEHISTGRTNLFAVRLVRSVK